MKLPKIRELIEAIKALFTGPYTSKFPGKPHVPHKNFRGQPKYDSSKCVGCLACEEICPAGAISHRDEVTLPVPRRIMIHYTDTCIFCGSCEAYCIANNEGIKLSQDWELSFFDRKKESYETIEKELVLCEICGKVIGCKDHLIWIAERIGELAFSNPTLYQTRLKRFGLVDENLISAARDKSRADRFKILCAPCRRAMTKESEPDSEMV
ncbi:MAG: 4Fe-4S binding protein [Spirochaetales bacterium]|nr:4Fe-4S binding protein [Spirochaetales bacterium]